MDYQTFIDRLPSLYENWGQDSVAPKSDRFDQVLKEVSGMTTANVMQLLNFAVECMKKNEIYCEIGTYQGLTLIGALLDRQNTMAYTVDNFSEYDPYGENYDILMENIEKFNLQEQVYFCNQDFEQFFLDLREIETLDKIGVYFYDGAQDYRSNLLGLLLAKPFLSSQAVIIVDNTNWGSVRQAIGDFVALNPESRILLELPTPKANHPSFGNGIYILSWDIDRKDSYPKDTLAKLRQKPVIEAIYNLQILEQKGEDLDNLLSEARSLQEKGDFSHAEAKYKQYLIWRNQDAQIWTNLGILYYQNKRHEKAIESLITAIEIDASQGAAYYNLGLAFTDTKNLSQAILAYENAISCAPDFIEAYNNLGNLFIELGELDKAETTYQKAIAANPNHFGSYLNLGNLLMEKNQIDTAIEIYQLAFDIDPNNADILNNLNIAINIQNNPAPFLLTCANKFYNRGMYREAINRYQDYLDLLPGDGEMYYHLADSYRQVKQLDLARKALQEGIQNNPTDRRLYFWLITTLQDTAQTETAIAIAETASKIFPDYVFKFFKYLLLPIVYDSQEEIEYYRQKFIEGLDKLIQETPLETIEDKKNALTGTGCVTNFYLAYQAHNVVNSQRQYGDFLQKVMAANYPEWVKTLTMPDRGENNKIRIGYASHYLHSYSGSLWLVGWFTFANLEEFEIYCYYTGNKPDWMTKHLRDRSHKFYHFPGNIAAASQQILADNLHILIYPELGMDPPTMQMAALRLAPVQCTAWGHPVTTGLNTIDYFLSSQLMEPENGQEHYSEILICLPNIGVSYPQPEDIPNDRKTRSHYQLKEDGIIYLCVQAFFKYLPQYDYILPEIALQVPEAQFLFLRGKELLTKRLDRAFAAVGLKSEDYCVFRTIPERYDYLMLNLISDVFLDTFTWSGGNTSLEAIACNLPIVTCPGEFMRGRHADSFLKMMGVTDTIAKNEADYINIAVKLGLDKTWRQEIADRLQQNQNKLFDDKICVKGLEDFYQQVVNHHLAQR